ncbi:MAG: prolyl oligopeptidase family serine peptidase [Oscillospiraceae bacterium]|nr:prolyl oligopeptidase family serine peptidase [Oscillospiraceae bacterium]
MKSKYSSKLIIPAIIMILILTGCASEETGDSERQSFAEERSGFTTTLTRHENSQFAIPTPPPGVFDLVHYESEVGRLAAFVSSDPGDGERHPLIIWVAGGWGYGISTLPWSYPEWDNDQTGSAFREAGILMMYPSFRGANGNPGYFETMFGDVDDLLAARDFAAALPYVDPDRIYLGGHSTGATRVLLAAALTDEFRAVFALGAVSDIYRHNQAQFTFDLRDSQERMMRSPRYWVNDISVPTFILTGQHSNSYDVRDIERQSTNDNIHTFVVDGAGHFDVLAPITWLFAQKILADTGASVNIQVTAEALQAAMAEPPVVPLPIMLPHYNQLFEMSFLRPVIWEDTGITDAAAVVYASPYHEDNFWYASYMVAEAFGVDEKMTAAEFEEAWGFASILAHREAQSDGRTVYIWEAVSSFDDSFFEKIALFQFDSYIVLFALYTPVTYTDLAMPMFERIISSISFD